jgi:hypothetical protein
MIGLPLASTAREEGPLKNLRDNRQTGLLRPVLAGCEGIARSSERRHCRPVGSYGAKGRSLRSAPTRLEHALQANGVEHDVKVYVDAGHSFMNDHDPAEVPTIFKMPAKLSGAQVHETSALDARECIIAFLDEHLMAPLATSQEGSDSPSPISKAH